MLIRGGGLSPVKNSHEKIKKKNWFLNLIMQELKFWFKKELNHDEFWYGKKM